ncbi:hypothetical protein N7456_004192 [Penicillium angulare]|uniref:Phosphoglycerate mutase family protein n=1 Tax=Penicillium angulare TaxID=116970 RepID=A0A9W9FW45_9EURO|nr:hypothetical protein N7456_004192 [Penicillium angulare]
MLKVASLCILAAAVLAVADPTVYLIRHGEKPDDGDGLSSQGLERAQCLRSVFGSSSSYNIGHIMAQTPQSGNIFPNNTITDLCHFKNFMYLTKRTDGSRQRPYDTVEPLAGDLGLTVDTSCDRDDPGCVKDVVDGYTGSGNILICWEHDALTDIVDKLGDDDAPDYPDDSFNIIWTDPSPYDDITSKTSENCPGLDD